MAWGGTFTDRGIDGANGTGTLVSDLFTGSPNSLILAVRADRSTALDASDIQGHDAGGAWTEIASIDGATSSFYFRLYAAHNGPSPANEQIVVNSDGHYMFGAVFRFYEVTAVYTDGTVAESFGAPSVDEIYPRDTLAFTIPSHANTEGLTFGCAGSMATSGTHSYDAGWTSTVDDSIAHIHSAGYIAGEDLSFTITSQAYTQHCGVGVEIVGAAAPSGPSLTILRRRGR